MSVALPVLVGLACVLVAARREQRLCERARHVAHEVRGPLTAARLVIEGAARRGDLVAGVASQLELELCRAAVALDDPHGAGAPAATADLRAVLLGHAPTWRALAAARGVRLVVSAGAGALPVRADGVRMAQAATNLVANAIEHGGGDVRVATQIVGGRVRVEVRDGGPGIAGPGTPGGAALRWVRRRRRRTQAGRGHGLAITARVLGACGGRFVARPGAVAFELPAVAAGPDPGAS